jgi:hypothetical protein
MTNLYLTLLDKVGVPAESIGDSTGRVEPLGEVDHGAQERPSRRSLQHRSVLDLLPKNRRVGGPVRS